VLSSVDSMVAILENPVALPVELLVVKHKFLVLRCAPAGNSGGYKLNLATALFGIDFRALNIQVAG
jgi:hypothetical protein